MFEWNPALFGRIRLDEAAVHRQMPPLSADAEGTDADEPPAG